MGRHRHSVPCKRDQLIHHFACAHVDQAEKFQHDTILECPKCRTKHMVVGADFEYLHGVYHCLDCRWSDSTLESIAHCLSCNSRFAADQALTQDVYTYHVDHYATGEILIAVDADSDLGPSALWEIVQPLADNRVGGVSGAVLTRNPFVNLLTRLEAYEYLHAIFLGRMVTAKLGILGIVSGAFGAFRTDQLKRIMGWDVGHGEDSDLTLRLRKSGLKIAFAPYAQCFTNVPTRWTKLFKQRRRWNRGVIRHKTRKHIDMAYFWSPSFKWGNFLHLLDAWVFRVGCLFAIWGFALMTILHPPEDLLRVMFALYLLYVALHN